MKKYWRLSALTIMATVLGAANAALAAHTGYHQVIDYKGETKVACCRLPFITLKDGIYLGVGAAYESDQLRQTIPLTAHPTVNKTGAKGSVFAGYGQYYEWFYIAGELFTSYSGVKLSQAVEGYHSTATVRQTYGASILPGFRVRNIALIYARLGYARTSFNIQENSALIGFDHANEWSNGIAGGIGVESATYYRFSLRGEYTYTSFSEFTSPLGTTFSPSSSTFTLGLVYHFC